MMKSRTNKSRKMGMKRSTKRRTAGKSMKRSTGMKRRTTKRATARKSMSRKTKARKTMTKRSARKTSMGRKSFKFSAFKRTRTMRMRKAA